MGRRGTWASFRTTGVRIIFLKCFLLSHWVLVHSSAMQPPFLHIRGKQAPPHLLEAHEGKVPLRRADDSQRT